MRILRTPLAMIGLMLLSSAALAQYSSPLSDTPITTADCETAWAAAPASESCTTHVLAAEQAGYGAEAFINRCAVKGYCKINADSEETNFTDFHGGPDGVRLLQNCSGTMKPIESGESC